MYPVFKYLKQCKNKCQDEKGKQIKIFCHFLVELRHRIPTKITIFTIKGQR